MNELRTRIVEYDAHIGKNICWNMPRHIYLFYAGYTIAVPGVSFTDFVKTVIQNSKVLMSVGITAEDIGSIYREDIKQEEKPKNIAVQGKPFSSN